MPGTVNRKEYLRSLEIPSSGNLEALHNVTACESYRGVLGVTPEWLNEKEVKEASSGRDRN
jgi:hypothetical protein